MKGDLGNGGDGGGGQCLKDIHLVSRIKQHDSDTLTVARISKQLFLSEETPACIS